MTNICEVISDTLNIDVTWNGKLEPSLEDFPDLPNTIIDFYNELSLDDKSKPMLFGSIDQSNANKDKSSKIYVFNPNGGIKKDFSSQYGYQRFVMEPNGNGFTLQKIPIVHGITDSYGDPLDSFLKILGRGFHTNDPINYILAAAGDGDDISYDNAFIGYPFQKELVLPRGFMDPTRNRKFVNGDRYQIIAFQTDQQLNEKNARIVSTQYVGATSMKDSCHEDFIGLIHLNSENDENLAKSNAKLYIDLLDKNDVQTNIVLKYNNEIMGSRICNLNPKHSDMLDYLQITLEK